MKKILNKSMKSFSQYLIEQKFKAEDYEPAIVIGFLINNNREVTNPDSHGIKPEMYERIMNSDSLLSTGIKIAQRVQEHFGLSGREKAEVFGRAKSNLSGFWKDFGATDTTPKTDILIGDKRLSLKMGNAQLMSGGKSESIATFHAALKNTPSLLGSPQIEKVESVLNEFVTSSLAPGQLRGIIKSGKDEVVNAAEKAHKECMVELNKLFQESNDFKVSFAREAMSGFVKYGERSNAAAEFMLVSTHDGSKVSIHSVYDDGYCASIANKIRLQARFKTSSRKVGGQKTGEYKYWSVVSLIVNAMEESIDYHNTNGEVLTENVLKEIGSRVRGALKSVLMFLKRIFKRSVSKVLSFFDMPDPDISHKNNINF